MNYLQRLSRAAYWELSKEDAADIINDYQEILEDKFLSEENLSHKPENPYQVIKCLRNNKQYFMWMLTFATMIMCLLSMDICLFFREFYLWIIVSLYILGQGLSIFYFRTTDHEKLNSPFPKKLLLLMTTEFVLYSIILDIAIKSYTAYNTGIFTLLVNELNPENLGKTITCIIQAVMTLLTGLSIFSLYKARVSDRRWRTLYNIGITMIGSCAFIFSFIYSTNLGSKHNIGGPFVTFMISGCIATGVSLL